MTLTLEVVRNRKDHNLGCSGLLVELKGGEPSMISENIRYRQNSNQLLNSN